MKKNINYYQQGDVLLYKTTKEDVKQMYGAQKTKNRTLQLGEATGHSHKVIGPMPTIHSNWRGDRIMEIKKPARLVHEEHKPIDLPAGFYKIQIVQEFDHFDEKTRFVMD